MMAPTLQVEAQAWIEFDANIEGVLDEQGNESPTTTSSPPTAEPATGE